MSKIDIDTPIKGEMLKECKAHLLEQSYMSGVERNPARVRATAEVFTPNDIVRRMVTSIGLEKIRDPEKRILDPACGDGQFLAYILWCRIEEGVPLEKALTTLFGIDIMEDNVTLCIQRLSCGSDNEKILDILENNIIEQDTLSRFPELVDGPLFTPTS